MAEQPFKIITTIEELETVCEQLRLHPNHQVWKLRIALEVLFEKNKEGNFTIPPFDNQRDEEDTEYLQTSFASGYEEGRGVDFDIAIPTINLKSGHFRYEAHSPYLLGGNRRRTVWTDPNTPDSWKPTDGLGWVTIKTYDCAEKMKKDYELIDNPDSALSTQDMIFGAMRALGMHNKVTGFIRSCKIAKVLKHIDFDNTSIDPLKTLTEYEHEFVMLSNILEYDSVWSPLCGKKNSNRIPFTIAIILMLKDRKRDPKVKEFLSKCILEGKKVYEDHSKYWTPIFERFGKKYGNLSEGDITLDDMKFSPLERILWETCKIQKMRKDKVMTPESINTMSYFGNDKWQFCGAEDLISFYVRMIELGCDGDLPYTTEKNLPTGPKSNIKVRFDVFGGTKSYETTKSKNGIPAQIKTDIIRSPYNEIMSEILQSNQGIAKFAA
tara:strand:- start:1235 stop:2548 length:1314 start_codon:yes stop_codon:yes gene_type:complete